MPRQAALLVLQYRQPGTLAVQRISLAVGSLVILLGRGPTVAQYLLLLAHVR